MEEEKNTELSTEEEISEEVIKEESEKEEDSLGILHQMRKSYIQAKSDEVEVAEEDSAKPSDKKVDLPEAQVHSDNEPKTELPSDSVLPSNKLEEMSQQDLIEEYKKLQTKLNEKAQEISGLQNKTDYEDFVKEISASGIESAFRKYGSKLSLPDFDEISSYMVEKQIEQSDLKRWQDTELLKQIKEKFNIEAEDFEYDPSEAYKADTPSYYFRVQTEIKEREFYENRIRKEEERNKLLEASRQKVMSDLENLKKTYFSPEEEELFEQKKKEFDELPILIREGKVGIEKDPFSVLNLFRAVHFDFLVQREVNKAIAKVHDEYKKKGVAIQEKEKPLDLTKVKGQTTPSPQNGKAKFSMIDQMIKNNIK